MPKCEAPRAPIFVVDEVGIEYKTEEGRGLESPAFVLMQARMVHRRRLELVHVGEELGVVARLF